MRKKVMKIYSILLVMLMSGIVIQSCCSNEDYKICGMSFYVNSYSSNRDSLYMYNLNTEDGIDTSYENVAFILNGQIIEARKECAYQVPFITSCYATQKCLPRIADSIPRSNIYLSLDRDIVVDNKTIVAGTNIISDQATSQYIDYSYDLYYDYQGHILVDSINFSKLNLDTGYYKLKLIATTMLGKQNTFERKVLFKR